MTSRVIACHGLGAMGWPIASRLRQQGARVIGLDADAAVQARWQQQAAGEAANLQAAHVVLVCVTDEAASRRVWQEQLPHWQRGALVIELGSVSHAWALQAAAACAAAGLRYADAPLSGGVAAAAAGELVAMLGAEAADLPELHETLAPFTAKVVHLGPPGAGQLCKMANQLAIAGVAAGLAQAQAFSRGAGLDFAQVLDVLSRGTAASTQLTRLRDTLVLPGNHPPETFAWLQKDLDACQQASPVPLPLARLWQAWWQAGNPDKDRRS